MLPVRAGKPRTDLVVVTGPLGATFFGMLAAITRTFTLNFMEAESWDAGALHDFAYIA